MDKLLIFIGGATVVYLIYLVLQYISHEGIFLPNIVKPYYEQIKCKITGFSKNEQSHILNATKEYLISAYKDRNRTFNNVLIENSNDYNFVECFVNIYIYINLKNLITSSESDKLKKHELLKQSFRECKTYLENQENYKKSDEVYYG